jgi:hypothetical protein
MIFGAAPRRDQLFAVRHGRIAPGRGFSSCGLCAPAAINLQTRLDDGGVSASRVRDSFVPIPRLSVAMHERDYQHVLSFNRIEHRIGEDAGQVAVNFVIEHRPTVRRFNDLLDGMFYRGHEP